MIFLFLLSEISFFDLKFTCLKDRIFVNEMITLKETKQNKTKPKFTQERKYRQSSTSDIAESVEERS